MNKAIELMFELLRFLLMVCFILGSIAAGMLLIIAIINLAGRF